MPESSNSRRKFLKSAGVTFSFTVAGVSLQLTPAQARQRNASLQLLSKVQASTLEVLAESIVPGSKTQGIVHFLDSQLAAPPAESLLMLKYLGVPAPYSGFYTTSLDSVANAVQSHYNKPLDALSSQQLEDLIDAISNDDVDHWKGPPASFFYFVLRSDAVDVVYGTKLGFSDLDIPYMAHIQPTTEW